MLVDGRGLFLESKDLDSSTWFSTCRLFNSFETCYVIIQKGSIGIVSYVYTCSTIQCVYQTDVDTSKARIKHIEVSLSTNTTCHLSHII